MAKYLITGAAGFIGSHLARALVERGDWVRGLDNFSTGRRENLVGLLEGLGGLGDSAALREPTSQNRDVGPIRGYFELLEGDLRDAGVVRGLGMISDFLLQQDFH